MSTFLDNFKSKELYYRLKKNYKMIFLAVFLILLLLTTGYLSWKKYGSPKLNMLRGKSKNADNKELINSSGKATIYYFYTEWCPYCKKAKPEWDKFKDVYTNKKVNGFELEFKEVDCDKDEATANQFNVEGYPTIKLVKDGAIVDYDAKPKFETLETFVKSSL